MKAKPLRGKELQRSIIEMMHLYHWTDCVPGQGAPNSGYHRQMRDGVRRKQHVWAWVDAYGEIPEGMLVHHECENKRCVNPLHLRLVTEAEHIRLHHSRDTCKYGHSRVGNTTKSGNCRTCMIAYLREYRATKRAAA